MSMGDLKMRYEAFLWNGLRFGNLNP